MAYTLQVPKEFLVWESDECTEEQWKFLCRLFGQSHRNTSMISVHIEKIEAYQEDDVVTNFCSPEDSMFAT